MQGSEVRAIGAVAGDGLARTGRVVGDVHRAVAGRAFGALGLMALPVRLMHDAPSRPRSRLRPRPELPGSATPWPATSPSAR